LDLPFNADDYTKAPWQAGVMELTNEECISTKEACEKIKSEFVPDRFADRPTTDYVVSHFNELSNYEEAINGDTYDVLEKYNPEVNTQGISPDAPEGIVPEPEEAPEEPTETPEEQPNTETPNEEENVPNDPETAPADGETTEPTEEA
jgi:hypothetical protein